jgi:hypothetical protein
MNLYFEQLFLDRITGLTEKYFNKRIQNIYPPVADRKQKNQVKSSKVKVKKSLS